MVESVKELKKICQNRRIPWYGRTFKRKISIYLTYLFLHTPITANQVTLLFVIIGLMGALLLATGSRGYLIMGAFLLFLHTILDSVDGEVARYRKTVSSTGIFLELMGHNIVYPSVFICLSFGAYQICHSVTIFAFGFSAALSIFLIRNRGEIIERAFRKHIHGIENQCEFASILDAVKKEQSPSLLKNIVDKTHLYFLSTHGVWVVVLLASFVRDKIYIVLYAYGIALPLTALVFMYHCVKQTRLFDNKCNSMQTDD